MLLAGSTRLLPFCIARRPASRAAAGGRQEMVLTGFLTKWGHSLDDCGAQRARADAPSELHRETPRAATRIKRIARPWRSRFLYYLFPRSNSPSAPAHSTTKRLFSCDKQSKPSGESRPVLRPPGSLPFLTLWAAGCFGAEPRMQDRAIF